MSTASLKGELVSAALLKGELVSAALLKWELMSAALLEGELVSTALLEGELVFRASREVELVCSMSPLVEELCMSSLVEVVSSSPLFCFSEHCLAMNHQEEIDEASPGAPWGAGVVAAEGSAVGSCAGHWVWDLHLA